MKKSDILLILCGVGLGAIGGTAAGAELRVVEHVDLERYLGTWYEIASIPAPFQSFCAGGTTATYTLLPNGKIEVKNACYTASGEQKVAVGRAWVADKKTNARLKVSFVSFLGLWLFAADYWVIDLGPNYEYAVVGHPSRKYGWILSRTPSLSEDVLQGIKARLVAQGYDVSRFKTTDQSRFIAEPPKTPSSGHSYTAPCDGTK
jgi:apolipoprotein D and lipocalin family protein